MTNGAAKEQWLQMQERREKGEALTADTPANDSNFSACMPSPWVQVSAPASRNLLFCLPAWVKPCGCWVADGEQKPIDWVLVSPKEGGDGGVLQRLCLYHEMTSVLVGHFHNCVCGGGGVCPRAIPYLSLPIDWLNLQGSSGRSCAVEVELFAIGVTRAVLGTL